MGDYVLFQMWGSFREHLIASHKFYVAEARARLLDQFTEASMKAHADRYADEWLAGMAVHFDPDRDDPSSHYEQAVDERVAFYLRLEDLRKSTQLSIIAGMYHEWEKQLRDWLGREIMRVAPGEHMRSAIWKQTVGGIIDFLESWQWPVRSQPYFRDLHLCHLVVNVYKHGSGTSFEELKAFAPALTGQQADTPAFMLSVLDHTNLTVGDTDLDRFSEAIIAFWRDVPENTFRTQMSAEPVWLQKALKKDLDARGG